MKIKQPWLIAGAVIIIGVGAAYTYIDLTSQPESVSVSHQDDTKAVSTNNKVTVKLNKTAVKDNEMVLKTTMTNMMYYLSSRVDNPIVNNNVTKIPGKYTVDEVFESSSDAVDLAENMNMTSLSQTSHYQNGALTTATIGDKYHVDDIRFKSDNKVNNNVVTIEMTLDYGTDKVKRQITATFVMSADQHKIESTTINKVSQIEKR